MMRGNRHRHHAVLFVILSTAALFPALACSPDSASQRSFNKRTTHSAASHEPLVDDAPLIVEVVAREFGWRYRVIVATGDGNLDCLAESENELHLPANSEVELRIASDDYLCTFAVPRLSVRKLAVPNLVFPVALRTGPAGRFDVEADATCGMKYLIESKPSVIVVESTNQFQQWMQICQSRGG